MTWFHARRVRLGIKIAKKTQKKVIKNRKQTRRVPMDIKAKQKGKNACQLRAKNKTWARFFYAKQFLKAWPSASGCIHAGQGRMATCVALADRSGFPSLAAAKPWTGRDRWAATAASRRRKQHPNKKKREKKWVIFTSRRVPWNSPKLLRKICCLFVKLQGSL